MDHPDAEKENVFGSPSSMIFSPERTPLSPSNIKRMALSPEAIEAIEEAIEAIHHSTAMLSSPLRSLENLPLSPLMNNASPSKPQQRKSLGRTAWALSSPSPQQQSKQSTTPKTCAKCPETETMLRAAETMVAGLQEAKEQLEQQLGECRDTITDLEEEKMELLDQIADAQTQNRLLEDELINSREDSRAHQEAHARIQAEGKELYSAYQAKQNKLKDLVTKQETLKANLAERLKEIEELREQQTNAELSIAQADEAARRAEEEAESLRSELDERSKEMSSLRMTHRKRQDELTETLRKVREERDELRGTVADLRNRLDTCEGDLKAEKSHSQELQAQLSSSMSSAFSSMLSASSSSHSSSSVQTDDSVRLELENLTSECDRLRADLELSIQDLENTRTALLEKQLIIDDFTASASASGVTLSLPKEPCTPPRVSGSLSAHSPVSSSSAALAVLMMAASDASTCVTPGRFPRSTVKRRVPSWGNIDLASPITSPAHLSPSSASVAVSTDRFSEMSAEQLLEYCRAMSIAVSVFEGERSNFEETIERLHQQRKELGADLSRVRCDLDAKESALQRENQRTFQLEQELHSVQERADDQVATLRTKMQEEHMRASNQYDEALLSLRREVEESESVRQALESECEELRLNLSRAEEHARKAEQQVVQARSAEAQWREDAGKHLSALQLVKKQFDRDLAKAREDLKQEDYRSRFCEMAEESAVLSRLQEDAFALFSSVEEIKNSSARTADASREAATVLQEAVFQAQQERDIAQQQLTTAQSALEVYMHAADSVTQHVRDLTVQLSSLHDRLTESEAQNSFLSAENETLRGDLDASETERVRLCSEIANLQRGLQSMDMKLRQQSEASGDSQSIIHTLEERLRELSSINQELEFFACQQQENNAKLSQELDQVSEESGRLSCEVSELNMDLEDAHQESVRLQLSAAASLMISNAHVQFLESKLEERLNAVQSVSESEKVLVRKLAETRDALRSFKAAAEERDRLRSEVERVRSEKEECELFWSAEKEALDAEVGELQSQLEETSKERGRLMSEHSIALETNSVLRTEVEKLRPTVARLQSESQSLRETNVQLQRDAVAVHRDLELARRECDAAKSELSSARIQLAQLESDKDMMGTEVERCIRKLESRAEELESALAESTSEVHDLRFMQLDLQSQLNDASDGLERAAKVSLEAQSLREKVAAHEKELNNKVEEIGALREALLSAQSGQSSLYNEYMALKHQVSTDNEKLLAADSQIVALGSAVERRDHDISTMKESIHSLEHQLRSSEQDWSARLRATAAELESRTLQVTSLQQSLQAAESEATNLREEWASCEVARKELRRAIELERAESERCKRLESEMLKLQEKERTANSSMERVMREKENLTVELKAMEQRMLQGLSDAAALAKQNGSSAAEQNVELCKQLQRLQATIAAMRRESDELKKDLPRLTKASTDLDKLKQEQSVRWRRAEDEMRRKDARIASLEEEADRLFEGIADAIDVLESQRQSSLPNPRPFLDLLSSLRRLHALSEQPSASEQQLQTTPPSAPILPSSAELKVTASAPMQDSSSSSSSNMHANSNSTAIGVLAPVRSAPATFSSGLSSQSPSLQPSRPPIAAMASPLSLLSAAQHQQPQATIMSSSIFSQQQQQQLALAAQRQQQSQQNATTISASSASSHLAQKLSVPSPSSLLAQFSSITPRHSLSGIASSAGGKIPPKGILKRASLAPGSLPGN